MGRKPATRSELERALALAVVVLRRSADLAAALGYTGTEEDCHSIWIEAMRVESELMVARGGVRAVARISNRS
jgi:hypothetical protein